MGLAAYVQYHDVLGGVAWLALISANVFLFGQDLIMFLGLNVATGQLFWTPNFSQTIPPLWHFLLVGQAWSLGIELMFYLIAPFLVRRSMVILLCFLGASFGLRVFLYQGLGLSNDPWTYRFFPTELALFLMGTLSYRYYEKYLMSNVNRFFAVCMTGSVLGFVVLSSLFWVPWRNHASIWLFYAWFCLALPYLFALSRNNAIDGRIGELSYPVYVVHILVISMLLPVVRRLGIDAFKGEIAVAASVIAAIAVVKLVTDPLERYRHARVSRFCRT